MAAITNRIRAAGAYAYSALENGVDRAGQAIQCYTLGRLAGGIVDKVLAKPALIWARPFTAIGAPLGRLSNSITDWAVEHIISSIQYKPTGGKLDNLVYYCDWRTLSSSRWTCKLIGPRFIAGFVEELVFRGLIQKKLLPFVSRILPQKIGNLLNNKITRVALTSLAFAASHKDYDLPYALGQGVVLGGAAEMTDSLAGPVLAHIANNLVSTLLFSGRQPG